MPNWRKEAGKIAKEVGVPQALFFSLIDHESGWNPKAVSPATAIGFTQLMPGTAKGLGVDPHDPMQNLRGGARYLKMQLDRFHSPRLALAAYNAGPGAVESGKWESYGETVRYVRNVLAGARRYGGAGVMSPPKAVVSPAGGVVSTVPVPLARTGDVALPGSADPLAQKAFEGLGKIAAGWKPESTLSSLVDAVSSQPTGAVLPPTTAPDQFSPVEPSAPASVRQALPPGGMNGKRPGGVTPGGRWAGSQGVVEGLAKFATGAGLKLTSAKRDRKLTKTGKASDHWTGSTNAYAEDLSNGYATPQMDAAAQQIARALGSDWTPRDGKLELTVIRDGYRIQVLYRTHLGGDHFTHIHVGAKKVSS